MFFWTLLHYLGLISKFMIKLSNYFVTNFIIDRIIIKIILSRYEVLSAVHKPVI